MKSSWLLAAVSLVSLLPGAQAYCYVDNFGVEHCRLSNAVRTGIAIAIIVIALIFIASALHYRRRRANNATFFTSQPSVNQNFSHGQGNGPGYYPSGYDAQAGYFPNGPHYPPHPHNGYTPPSNTYGSPDHQPPPAYYPPPAGPPPAVTKAEA